MDHLNGALVSILPGRRTTPKILSRLMNCEIFKTNEQVTENYTVVKPLSRILQRPFSSLFNIPNVFTGITCRFSLCVIKKYFETLNGMMWKEEEKGLGEEYLIYISLGRTNAWS